MLLVILILSRIINADITDDISILHIDFPRQVDNDAI